MKVGIAFPWVGLRERQHGSAQRAGLLVDFLSERVDEVRVLSPAANQDVLGGNIHEGNVRYSYYSLTEDEVRRADDLRQRLRNVARRLSRQEALPQEEGWLWRHIEHMTAPSLTKAMADLVERSDVVIISFTFWSRPIARLAHRKGIPVIVTTHDVISGQIQNNWLLRWLTQRLETGGLAKADYRFASSEADQARFRALGVRTEIVLPGVDLLRPVKSSGPDHVEQWRRKLQLPDDKSFCLFVGSGHGPNIPAVQAIRGFATSLSQQGLDDICFLIVGDAAPVERGGNFIALGLIEEEALNALYKLSEIVLVPLQAGTGTSRKTLEALAFGKPVLATSIGFRGIPVQSGVNGVVCDDLQRYPDAIVELLANDEMRRRLGTNARTLAESFDYRRVYERYMEIISRYA